MQFLEGGTLLYIELARDYLIQLSKKFYVCFGFTMMLLLADDWLHLLYVLGMKSMNDIFVHNHQ